MRASQNTVFKKNEGRRTRARYFSRDNIQLGNIWGLPFDGTLRATAELSEMCC